MPEYANDNFESGLIFFVWFLNNNAYSSASIRFEDQWMGGGSMNNIAGFTDFVKICKVFEIHFVDANVIDIKIGDAQSSNIMKKVGAVWR